MRKQTFLLLVFAGSLLSFGCERPFVDVSTPQITIISPEDLNVAIPQNEFTLRLRSTSFREVTQVLVNGTNLVNIQNDEWSINLTLHSGLNAFIIEAIDADLVASLDTIHVLRSDLSISGFGPRLPAGLGGFALTVLNGGSALLSGGAPAVGTSGQTRLYTLQNAEDSWQVLPARLVHGRVGHSATLLPDGRVLVAGGASRDNVSEISHLEESVEIVDVFAQVTTEIVVSGDPIRRTYHSASIRTTDFGTILDLYGGIGDITYTTSARLGTRADIRSFLLRNDSLLALNSGLGATLRPGPVAGHSQTQLRATTSFAPTQFLVIGAFPGSSNTDPDAIAFEVDFADPLGIVTHNIQEPRTLRTDHADIQLGNGNIALFGGRVGNGTNALSSIEVFSESAGHFFELPVVISSPVRRFKHGAIRLTNGTILVIGGFTENGLGTTTAEIVTFGF